MRHIEVSHLLDPQPWLIPLSKRLEKLSGYLRGGSRVCLMIYEQADTSTFRYRAYNICQVTDGAGSWRSVYFFRSELKTAEAYLDKVDLVVVIRFRWCHDLDHFIQKARQAGRKVLFDVDDLICDLNYLPMVTNTLNVNLRHETDYNFWFSVVSRMEYTARLVDGFTTTNPFLGQRLQERFQKPYYVIPNFLNKEQIEISELCNSRKKIAPNLRPFTIGYFSGTPSHINDFGEVYGEIMQLLADYPEMNLKVVGFMDFPAVMKPLIQKKRVESVSLVDFLELQRLISEVDVNIAPLFLNTFTECKSELKYFEAALVHTPTCATPTYTFRNCIRSGENGFLCRPGDWYPAIERLFKNPSESVNICQCAYREALGRYAGETVRGQIEKSYDAALL